MNHKGTVTIETERLTLRRYRAEDVESAFNNWMSNPNVTKFLRWETHGDISVTREYFDSVMGNYSKSDSYDWIIELKSLGEPIGSIGAVALNERAKSVEIGYCIGEQWWHCGYTSEALAAVTRFFFEEVGMNRVWSEHDAHNPNLGKVMEKCGMKYEGTLRQSDFNNSGICDSRVYGILAEEWKNR